MKKKLLIVISLFLVITLSASLGAYASSKLTLVVNGKISPTEPILHNNSIYVPIRAIAELLGANIEWNQKTNTATVTTPEVITLVFPVDDYPATATHIASAIQNGSTAVCTIDRDGSNERSALALKDVPTKPEFDRAEWPMPMCKEGGKGASVAFVDSIDKRGAVSWVENTLSKYPDGTKIAFAVMGIDTDSVDQLKKELPKKHDNIVFNNCTEAKAAGAAPIYKGDPGYSTKLDRDGDGIACE